MSQYSPYMLNAAANNDNSQYNNNNNNMPAFDVNNMLKNLFENNGNALVQNMNSQDNLYFQQNKLPNQYYIHVPQNYPQIPQQYMPMMPLPNGNVVYVNQSAQFSPNEHASQYNGQLLPIQVPSGIMQQIADNNNNNNNNNNQNKPNDLSNPINSRSRKKTYKTPNKQELGSLIDPNEDVPRDTRNRPLSFSCSECNKRFSTQSRLDQHFLCHTNERPYVCSECLFAFTQKSYLMRHAAVHREERSFECELCKKTYKHYGSLANHRKTHKNGNKSSARLSLEKDHITQTTKLVHNKVEEVVDMNTSSSSSYVPVSNTDYLFQNQAELKQEHIEQHQPYNAQYNIDIAAAMFSNSFQNQLSVDLSTDGGSSFLDQLNFNNSNFYPMMTTNSQVANTDMSLETTNSHNLASDLKNSSSISLECSSQPISFSQSNAQEECIATYTV